LLAAAQNLTHIATLGCSILPRRRISSLTLGEKQPRPGAVEGGLKVLGEAAVAVEPRKGALDHPAAGQDDKSGGGIGAFDDLDRPPADLIERGIELGAAVGAVGKTWRSQG